MNADSIAKIHTALTRLRHNPATKKRFPSEIWDAIIQLTKTYSHKEVCEQLQLNPCLLRRKIKQHVASTEFYEIPLVNISSESVVIDLISTNGLQVKIQGPLSCLNCLQQLLKG